MVIGFLDVLAISQSTHCRNRLQSPADAAPAEHSSGHRRSERRPQAVHHLRTVPNASLGVLCGATGWGGTRQQAPGSPPKQLSLSIGVPKKRRKSQISIVSKFAHVFLIYPAIWLPCRRRSIAFSRRSCGVQC